MTYRTDINVPKLVFPPQLKPWHIYSLPLINVIHCLSSFKRIDTKHSHIITVWNEDFVHIKPTLCDFRQSVSIDDRPNHLIEEFPLLRLMRGIWGGISAKEMPNFRNMFTF